MTNKRELVKSAERSAEARTQALSGQNRTASAGLPVAASQRKPGHRPFFTGASRENRFSEQVRF
jgi:hypothetical protein